MTNFLKKLKEVIPYSLLPTFTFFVFGPLQLFVSNSSEFWFNLGHILPMIIVSFILTFLLFAVISIILPQKIRKYFLALLFGIGFALYIQGNFLNLDYGVMDGTEIDWASYGFSGVLNTSIWLACIFVPVILVYFWPKQSKKITTYISLFIIGIQVITVGTLLITTDLSDRSDITVTDKGMFSLSKEKNDIIFILDTFDASYMNVILETCPEYREYFKDFTYYDNALN